MYRVTEGENDTHLDKVMQRIQAVGLKLRREKCSTKQGELRFLGHLIDRPGIWPNPDKVEAIWQMSPPANVQQLKMILGMISYLGRFIPNLSTVGQPLYELLKNKTAWSWSHTQQNAFEHVKELLTTAPVLAYYDMSKPTAASADASSYGLGGVLLQLHGGQWKPIAYCSRRLTEAETRCLCGLENFKLVNDHKPLVPLINSHSLDDVPLQCQRLLMRFMRFNSIAEYAPGKTLIVTDTLPRSPLTSTCTETEKDTTKGTSHLHTTS